MQLTDKPSVPAHVMARHIDNETVILNLDNGTYYGLDPVGARFWQLLTEDKTLDEVCAALLQEYEVDRPTLEADILDLANQLLAQGLLQVN